MKRDNTPQENLLGLIALAAEHVQHGRYSYAATALSVAMDMARKLAGEEEPGQGAADARLCTCRQPIGTTSASNRCGCCGQPRRRNA